ncbi:cyclic nucleotide-binding domain-containing protein [Acaryochloris sp. CCMEE 5410]|uniref:cyclic nucleotide-binding domain-containing protein n=1 Tax=Acaryochloris sp. CCMEE 5410 TaxID=310037 RepID=UPI0002483CC3|nr:cyclic nucleotide-binding domain-containing protein [Acaryochloris sp. CCMEE 5410]KAI9132038.1 cyclic nucleotide-binding domain-containing protein [Acaryochloris sp. CCMEE 5410]
MPYIASTLQRQWRRLNLTTKFSLILSMVFMATTGIAGVIVHQSVHRQADHELKSRGQLLMALVDQLNQDDSASEAYPVVSTLCETQPSLCYKVLVPNSDTMLPDIDELAEALKTQFQKQIDQETLSGYITHADQENYYFAQRLDQDGTLQIQAVFIPSAPVKELAKANFWMEMGTLVVLWGLILLLVNDLVRRTVLKPIQPITQLAHQLRQAPTRPLDASSAEILHLHHHARHKDEIGQLAGALHHLFTNVYHRPSSSQQASVAPPNTVPNSVQALLSQIQIPYTHELLAKSRQVRQQLGQSQDLDLLRCLQSVDFLQDFSENQLQDLIACGYQRQYEPGEVIFRAGELGQVFYIILNGVIQSQMDHPERQGNKWVSGDAFGETALLSGVARQNTILAVEQTTLFVIEDQAFQRLLRQFPQLGNRLLQRHTQLADILRQVDYFQNWPEIEFQQLLDRGYRQNLAAEESLIPESGKVYFVIFGGLQFPDQNITLTAGNCWGDLSLLFDDLPPVQGQTFYQTSLFIVETSDLLKLLKRYPHLVNITANVLWQRKPEWQGHQISSLNWIRDRLQSQLPPI